MANSYQIGDTVTLNASFTFSGTAIDPSIVDLDVLDPSGNKDTYTLGAGDITKSATGKYTIGVFVDESGDWQYRYFGSGTNIIQADESYFTVERSHF